MAGILVPTPQIGGMTLLSTTTLSGASTTISGIDQSYRNLQVVLFGMTNATADGLFKLQPNGSNNIATTILSYGDAGTNVRDFNSDGRFGDFNITRTDANNHFVFNIYDYANTTRFKAMDVNGQYRQTSVTGGRAISGGGSFATNSAITSLVILNTGGNWSTGTVLLYGVK